MARTPPRRKVLYILSPGHSGSTLVTLLLATHPDVATIGERHYLIRRLSDPPVDRNFCLCGEPVPSCKYLTKLAALGREQLAWYQRSADFSRFQYHSKKKVKRLLGRVASKTGYGQNRGLLGRLAATPYRNVIEANRAIIDHVLATESATVFLDGSKSTVDFHLMSKSGLFDMIPIRLSRDGRGQYHSFMRQRPGLSPDVGATKFLDWCERIDALLEGWAGHPVVRVHYEKLCENPEFELRRIASECGLDPNGVSTDFRTGAKHAIGNGRVVIERTGKIKNEEIWRKELSDEDLEVFERIAGKANRALGYGV